jgi:hypothetical protein
MLTLHFFRRDLPRAAAYRVRDLWTDTTTVPAPTALVGSPPSVTVERRR